MNRIEKISSKIVMASLRLGDVVQWLKLSQLSMPKFRNLTENDEDAIHGEMIHQGMAQDTNHDIMIISRVLKSIREEMAWTGEDFWSTVKNLGRR
jgi:hypothetical protein